MSEDAGKKEREKRSENVDGRAVRIQGRKNNRRGVQMKKEVGATTGRINSQPKRSKHRGKNDPAEEEWIMLREKHLGVDELPQQWEEIKQTQGRKVSRGIGKEE